MKGNVMNADAQTSWRLTGVVSLVQGLLIFIPTIVLGQAIGWPASLGDPASVALPRLLEQESAVRLGYSAYLFYSMLFAVTIVLLAKLSTGKSMANVMSIIVGFAIASTVARSIGIIRWLIPAPQLAKTWELAATDQERYAISLAYDLMNAYGGTIGEVLGVGLFAAVAVLVLCVASLQDQSLPKWLVGFGVIAALWLIATTSEVIGIAPDFIVVFLGTTLIQFWFMAVGIWLLIRSRQAPQPTTVRN
ncbi:MAG: DUF4386 domain-containing protein [Roseiflexaceae bacterium]|jgi:hypothetical protein